MKQLKKISVLVMFMFLMGCSVAKWQCRPHQVPIWHPQQTLNSSYTGQYMWACTRGY